MDWSIVMVVAVCGGSLILMIIFVWLYLWLEHQYDAPVHGAAVDKFEREPEASSTLAPRQIQSAPTDVTENGSRRYLHEYQPASSVQEKSLFGVGTPQEIASEYPSIDIEGHLNLRAESGWELVHMEADWHWERVYISMAMSVTKPLAIVGWFLTFRKAQPV